MVRLNNIISTTIELEGLKVENIKYIIVYVVLVLSLWSLGVVFSKSVSDHEVITPKADIECVVVSRMFNISVDCWKANQYVDNVE